MKNISYTQGNQEQALIELTIGGLFETIVEKYPNNEALVSVHQDIRWTYSELKEKVDRCAKALLTFNVVKGDRVGIWSPNCAEWLVVQIATAKIGAILVNINPSYRLHELEYALHQSGCKIVVLAEKSKYSSYVEMMHTLIPELDGDNEIDCEKFPRLKRIISLGEKNYPGMLPWEIFMSRGKKVSDQLLKAIMNGLGYGDAINIQYTSGTTGYPKGVTLSHYNILNNGYLVSENMNLEPKDRLIIPVPLYHCFGMVLGNLGCITHGATMIYSGENFEAEQVLETVEKEKATALFGVPTMFLAEVNHPDLKKYDLSSLRTGVMAGALCPEELMIKVNKDLHIPEILIAYGMTETSPVSTQTRRDAPFLKRVTTVGTVMPYTEVRIVNPETNETVKIGETGELCTRGYCVMLGYWENEEQTREAIDEEHWIHSGDLATLDEDGYISIVGRIKDMIIRGGENIYPKEIEEFIFKHPKIKNVQVIGIPSERYGEEVCAWLQLKDGESMTEEEVMEYCKGNIAYYKIPAFIRFVSEFPMTVTGKIRKVEMREMELGGLTLDA